MFLGVQVEYNGYKVRCSRFRTRAENYDCAYRVLCRLTHLGKRKLFRGLEVSYFKEY